MTTRREQLECEAKSFHADHPEVWQMFCKFAETLWAAGRRRIGVSLIWERMRWETMVNPDYADSSSGIKLSNNHRAFYARWYMAGYPDRVGFFVLREQRSVFDQVDPTGVSVPAVSDAYRETMELNL